MKKTVTSFLLFIFLSVYIGYGQGPEITFLQGEQLSLSPLDNDLYELKIKPESFTLVFKGNELHVCTGLSEELFQFTKPETDINQDFNSYFFIFKYIAMPEDANYLPVGKDEAASLNKTHGAKLAGKDSSKFTVASLQIEDELKPLNELKEFYLALWLDTNLDQFIDTSELLKVHVVIE
ncbi:hypothetical protein [uncultured Muriicola sp.]|uniref:hypothetical protein n=1 Tax=uncultured Muriicola sp. TaxID=1583102 RepID=UPI0026054CF4|nr:hypothetical protein [uncultured Muriicola sp.]